MKQITVIDNPYNERRKEVEILIPEYPAGSWGAWLETRELDSEAWAKILQHGILFFGPDDENGQQLQWGAINKRLTPEDLHGPKEEEVPSTNFFGGPVNMLCGSYQD